MVMESMTCWSVCFRPTLLVETVSSEPYPIDELIEPDTGGGDTRGTIRTVVPFTASCKSSAKSSGPLSRTKASPIYAYTQQKKVGVKFNPLLLQKKMLVKYYFITANYSSVQRFKYLNDFISSFENNISGITL